MTRVCSRCGANICEDCKIGFFTEPKAKEMCKTCEANICSNCLIGKLREIGQTGECEICRTVVGNAIRCPKCQTILCQTCNKGHKCQPKSLNRSRFSNWIPEGK